jgi:hypothetical protein
MTGTSLPTLVYASILASLAGVMIAFPVFTSKIAVPSGMWLELTWRDLRHNEVIWSSGEVNRLIDELGSQGLPSIDFAHIDLT